MTTYEFDVSREHLLAIIGQIKPDKREAFNARLTVAPDDNTPTRRHLALMAAVGELYDGLAYGNWPR